MQQARKEMEELTAFHIKLHRLQVPSTRFEKLGKKIF